MTAATEAARLHLITPTSTRTQKATMPKTTPPMTQEEKLAALKTMIRDNVTASRPRAVRRNPNQMRLVEHAHLVRDSLEAVRSLALARHGSDESGNGAADDLQILDRNHLGALLELISDRLGTALEMDGR